MGQPIRRTHVSQRGFRFLPLILLGFAILACSTSQKVPVSPQSSTAGVSTVLLAAGDIATCGSQGDELTAAIIESIPGTVATLGDNAYQKGSATEYERCYAPTWGRFKARTRPAPGNHEYSTPGATGYYNYFGAAAGDPTKGYYSYELGTWHVVVLNSSCGEVGGCEAGSPQELWLRSDLASHDTLCTLAYWHHPRFSSGEHGNNDRYEAFWRALYDSGADVVLSAHDHDYERFAPQDPDGKLDLAGMREFVVGTGGGTLQDFAEIADNSEVRQAGTYGVLQLTLNPGVYDWEFVSEPGADFQDSGSLACH